MPPRLKAAHEKLAPRRKRSPVATIVVVALAVTGAAAIALSRPSQPEPSATALPAQTSLPADVSPLLDGLRLGDRIGGWEVHAVRSVDRKLGVDLLQNELLMTVWIARKGVEPKLSPRETERYSLFIGYPPESQAAAARDFELVLTDFAQRLERTERTSVVPHGL
jgi:hypothetical protein